MTYQWNKLLEVYFQLPFSAVKSCLHPQILFSKRGHPILLENPKKPKMKRVVELTDITEYQFAYFIHC
jgi:hypothetical protein